MANPTFTRYKAAALKALRPGEQVQYIRNQGYIRRPMAAAAAGRAVTPAPAPAPGVNAYADTIKNEGIYAADQADIRADNTAAQVQADAARKALAFNYNDPNNPYNEVAQLKRQGEGAIAESLAERAARGVLMSGGTRLEQQDLAYKIGQAETAAAQQYAGQLGTIEGNLAAQQRQNFGRSQESVNQAYERLVKAGVAPSVAAAQARATAGGGAASSAPPAPAGRPTADLPTGGVPTYLPPGATYTPPPPLDAATAAKFAKRPTVRAAMPGEYNHPGAAGQLPGDANQKNWVEGKDYQTVNGPMGTTWQRPFYDEIYPGSKENFFVPFSVTMKGLPSQGTPEWYALKKKYGHVKTIAQARALWGKR